MKKAQSAARSKFLAVHFAREQVEEVAILPGRGRKPRAAITLAGEGSEPRAWSVVPPSPPLHFRSQ